MSILPKIHLSKTNLTKFFLILFLGLVLTIIFTWPMIFKLTTLYSDEADYTLVGWIMWYNQLSFVSGRIFSSIDYYNALQFYPWPYALAFSENLFLPSVLFAPLYWLTGQLVFSVNTYTFSTFILTFICSFYIFNKLLKNNLAAILASVIFTFNPLTAAHFPGHTHLLGKFFLPLVFVTSLRFFAEPKIQNAFLLWLFFTLNALTSINFFIVSVPSVLYMGLPYIGWNLYHLNWRYFKSLLFSSAVLILFLPIFIHFILPYKDFSDLEGAKRTVQESVYFSAQPLDWFLVFPESLLYKNFVKSFDSDRVGYPAINYSEHTLGLNIIPVILFILGSFYLPQKIKTNPLKHSAILTLLVGCFIFTFGPLYETTKLPYYYFNYWTGILDGTRVPTRFQFFFYLPFSLIAGMGFIFLSKYFKKKTLLFIILLGIITLENFNVWQIMGSTSSLTNNPAIFQEYRQFSFLKDKTTLHLPSYIGPFEKQIYYLNLATIHQERLMNGYSGYFPPEWSDLIAQIEQNLDQKSFQKLLALKTDYVIIHKDRFPDKAIEDLKNKHPLLKDLAFFEDSNYLVLKIENKKIAAKQCLLSDIKIEPVSYSSSFGITPTYFNRIKVTNPKDCYFTNILEKRYLKTEVNLNSYSYPVMLRMPVVLGPFEEKIIR